MGVSSGSLRSAALQIEMLARERPVLAAMKTDRQTVAISVDHEIEGHRHTHTYK